MKATKSISQVIWPAFAMTLLVLDAKTGLIGAREGVDLCIRTVIPSLFPFLLLSGILTDQLLRHPVNWLRPLGRLCHIPAGSEGLLAIGLIGGYPVGAQCIMQAYRHGSLSKQTSSRMLGFCNNAGPSFLFGILTPVFSSASTLWSIWGILLGSSLLTGILLPKEGEEDTVMERMTKPEKGNYLKNTIMVTAYICGWVVIFRVILSFLQRWMLFFLPKEIRVAVFGFLELTNGCCKLVEIDSERIRFILATGMLSMGGICVWMQTASVISELGMWGFIRGKLIQSCISLALSVPISSLIFTKKFPVNGFLTVLCGIAILSAVCNFLKKHSSFLRKQGV